MSDSKKLTAAYTLIIPLDREKKQVATFHIRELTEDVYVLASSLYDAKKRFDAVRLILRELRVDGDDPAILKDNIPAMMSAAELVGKLIEPLEGELKKN